MILLSKPGGTVPGSCGSGLSYVPHYRLDFRRQGLCGNIRWLLRSSVEEEVRLKWLVVFVVFIGLFVI